MAQQHHAANHWLWLGGISGVVAPLLTLGLILYTVAISPWFNWHRDALSDLGVREHALLFNSALAVNGLLSILVALGVGALLGRGWLTRAGVGAMVTGALGVGLISVITQEYDTPHFLLAAAYFILTPLGYLLLAPAMFRQGRAVMGTLSIAAGMAAMWLILLLPHQGLAVPELTASLIIGAWTFSLGVEMLNQACRREA